MAISTYTELKTAIANWLDRTDLTDRIPEFIALAEAEIRRRLRTRDQLEEDDITISAEYIDLPSDWVETDAITLDAALDTPLEFFSRDAFRRERIRYSNTGKPAIYTIVGRRIRVAPVPDGSYAAFHDYYQRVPSLTGDAPTNWLLTDHPDLYLAAGLVEANRFLRDIEAQVAAAADFDRVLASIKLADERANTPTTPAIKMRPLA